jgi:DNA helicase-2/ATP-dependent DNA helicase PcrA
MRSRVETLLEMDCQRMWISTFHALCARLLRREAPHVGLSRDFVIYDSNDQLSVVKQGLKELGIDDSATQPRMVLSRISHAKNRMEGPETFARALEPRDSTRQAVRDVRQGAQGRQGARLRRPAALHGGADGEVGDGARKYAEQFRT